MNPDGLSYLDMASEAVIGGPSKLVNTYWSPGYSAFIGMGLQMALENLLYDSGNARLSAEAVIYAPAHPA